MFNFLTFLFSDVFESKNLSKKGGKLFLLVEVPQSNGHVAEVRFICDECGRLIGTRFMLETQVEEEKSTKTVCQQCKEGKHFQSKKKSVFKKH